MLRDQPNAACHAECPPPRFSFPARASVRWTPSGSLDGPRLVACWRATRGQDRTSAPGRDKAGARHLQADLRGPSPGDLRAGTPTDPEDDRARDVLVRRDLVDRVRDRRDPLRHRGRAVEPRARSVEARPDRDRGRAPARDRRHVVPPDDLRVSERRRLLHRQPREPRRDAVARRRCFIARRLHPDGGGVDLRRCRRDHLDSPVRVAPEASCPRRARQSSRSSRSSTCAASRSPERCSRSRRTCTSSSSPRSSSSG